jgi:hypothetical protein
LAVAACCALAGCASTERTTERRPVKVVKVLKVVEVERVVLLTLPCRKRSPCEASLGMDRVKDCQSRYRFQCTGACVWVPGYSNRNWLAPTTTQLRRRRVPAMCLPREMYDLIETMPGRAAAPGSRYTSRSHAAV